MSDTTARRAYLSVNIILAGVILLIMGYSALFSPDGGNYPVACIHEKLTGEPCPSCGMSHAFSLIMRGRIDEALQWNSYSLRLFIFFALQLAMRIGLFIWLLRPGRQTRLISMIDTIISSVMTLFAFYPFLRVLWLTLL